MVAELLVADLMAGVQSKVAPGEMPILSGEDLRLHDAVAYWESAQGALAFNGLLKAAMGMEPDEAKKIVDIDLGEIPNLPQEHPGYERRLETRLRIRTQNKSNRMQRYAIIMRQRTDVYSAFYKSAEPKAPIFARELRESCDYTRDNVAGGYFDGVTAYRMVYNKLFAEERTQMDVDFYNTAKDLQIKARLPDGCAADDFMAKAIAWIYKIRPHLAQPFNDEDAAKYIINMMPNKLGADARRIEQRARDEGKFTDLMHLARELKKEVYRDSNKSAKTPALITVDDEIASAHDLMMLADMTGMTLVASTPSASTIS